MATSDYRPHKASAEFAVRRFRHPDDFEHLKEWMCGRSMATSPIEEVPRIGFIVWKEGKPIAAAFLRDCEGGIGIFDSMITDPKSALFTRHLAIEILINKVMIYAKENRVRRLLAFTTDAGILKRSIKHGFKKQSHSVISLIMPT